MNESLERLKKRLLALPRAAKKAAREAVFEEAFQLANLQRRVVPVESGALRDSIRVEDGKHDLQAVVLAGGKTTTVAARSGQGKYDYANAVEFGNSESKAQPFFFPSYRLKKKKMRSNVNRKTRAAVKKEFASGG